jgi:hypothetical protein
MKYLIVLIIIFPIFSLACGVKEKPELIIEADDWDDKKQHCVDYEFIFPTEYKEEDIMGITITNGTGRSRLELPLSIGVKYDKDVKETDFSNSYICSSNQWLSDSEISISYRPRPKNGWVLACHTNFKYDNLDQYIVKKAN